MPAPVVRYKVTMVSNYSGVNGETQTHRGEDYVAQTDLDAYIADAKSRGWQEITVSDKPDHGPGGPNGVYHSINERA